MIKNLSRFGDQKFGLNFGTSDEMIYNTGVII